MKLEELTFPALLENSFCKHSDREALGIAGKKPLTYTELKTEIYALIAFFEKLNIEPGDKVAILSRNMPNWGIAYLSITFMGAVAVPILPDFHPGEIENILNHSESKAIFLSQGFQQKITGINIPLIETIINLEDFSIQSKQIKNPIFDPFAKPQNKYPVKEDDLAAIIYTSGTTGNSKGVMLTHKNISFTAIQGGKVQYIDENDRFLSVLPLSHTYENTLGFILPLIKGACVYYLDKPPTAPVLLPALQKIKPTIMLTVPLIIEKVYRNSILPKFTKNKVIRFLYQIPFIRKKLNQLAGKKLLKTFGGKLHFYGIGGAKLDKAVEQFLQEAKFPYAIGYGLTETSPLLAGVNPKTVRLESTGPAINGVQLKLHNINKITSEGEIWASGPNVMKGYYKNQALTNEVITEEGWFKTGDLGKFDKDGYLYIKSRLKNMIVGTSGENIYPEEIESVINNFNYVSESLVFEQKGKLVALVHFNKEELEKKFHHLQDEVSEFVEHKIEELLVELKLYVNKNVNKFSQLQLVMIQPAPFEKTPTQKIKRFLYTKPI